MGTWADGKILLDEELILARVDLVVNLAHGKSNEDETSRVSSYLIPA